MDIAEWLVGLGNDVNAKAFNGDTPMHLAAWRDRLDACKWFYAHGADPNSKKRDGATPFHVACSGGSVPVASWLLTVGADINTKANNGDMGIHLAAWVRGKLRSHCCCAALSFVRDLVLACVCWTPLSQKGQTECIRFLVDRGADVNARKDSVRSCSGFGFARYFVP